MALDHCGRWKVAEVMEIREEEVDSDDESSHRDFEYYVNYLEHERRNDRWIKDRWLKIDKELIKEAEKQYEKIKIKEKEDEMAEYKFLHNNVHGNCT